MKTKQKMLKRLTQKDVFQMEPQDNHFTRFSNTDCEYFPCHEGGDSFEFNCLFCYCPLYTLGKRCGGAFRYAKNGIKDCSACVFPHLPENYGIITARFPELVDLIQREDICTDRT